MPRFTSTLLWSGFALLVCGMLAALYTLATPPPRPEVAPPSETHAQQAQRLCQKMYPTQPDMEQACRTRWTQGGDMPGPTRPAAPDTPRPEDYIRAASVICQVQLGYTEGTKITSMEQIALFDACLRAYLAREGIHLPRAPR